MVGLLVAAGCGPTPDPENPPPSDPLAAATGGTAATGSTGTTGDTATVAEVDCDALPAPPFIVRTFPIQTTEDFDFDALGSLVYSDGNSFVAVDSYGGTSVIAPSIHDTRGIQILADGNIAACYITQGRIAHTDRVSGASTTLLANLSGPNALDVGHDGVMYVTETGGYSGGGSSGVSSFDPATGAFTRIADGFFFPNGITLNEEQDRMYVADDAYGVYRLLAETGGGWGDPELIVDPPGTLGVERVDGIETDICGNLYVAQLYNGEIRRFDPDTLEVELLVDLDDAQEFLWNSIRWGSGRGIWRRDVLYVTDRNKVFGVEVGVPGRTQPVDQMP